MAGCCGVKILTCTILSAHFHVLIRLPTRRASPPTPNCPAARHRYPKPTAYQTARLNVIEVQLNTNGPEAQAWRPQHLAFVAHISRLMKLREPRFSIRFNQSHHRNGTRWAKRIMSVLVEPQDRPIETMVANIDLNWVRAITCRRDHANPAWPSRGDGR